MSEEHATTRTTTKGKLASIGAVLAVISGFIGIWTFVFKTYGDYLARIESEEVERQAAEIARKAEARAWGKLTVISILESEGPVTFEDLYDQFTKKGLPEEARIMRAELSEDFLRRVLLELYESQVVFVNSERRYDLNRGRAEEASVQMLAMNSQLVKEQRVRNAIGAILQRDPNRYSKEDIASRVSVALQLDRDLVLEVLEMDLLVGSLTLDVNGKVSITQFVPPQSNRYELIRKD